MKLRKDFLIYTTDEKTLLVPSGGTAFSGVVRGNKTFGAILELLKMETSPGEIVNAMTARFDVPEDTVRQDVEKVLSELRNIGALDE